MYYNDLCDSQTGLEGLYDEACHHGIGLHPSIQLVEETRMGYRDALRTIKSDEYWFVMLQSSML